MRKITAEDLLTFRFASDPQISPDGRRVAFVVKSIEENKYVNRVWVDGMEFTRGDDTMPRWSPDGKQIAFVRKKDDQADLWLIGIGEARPLTKLPPGKVKSLDWSPDGTRLAFTFHPRTLKKGEQPVARHVTRMWYKDDGEGFRDGEHDHVWIVWARDGKTLQITNGDWEDADPAWSPDGAWLAFASNRLPDVDYRPLEIDLWIVAAGGGEPRKLPKPPGPAMAPSWSPDGKQIAFLGNDDPESSWGIRNTHLWLVPASGKEPARDVMRDFDRTCEDVTVTDTKSFHGVTYRPSWDDDGVCFLASDAGRCHLHRWNGKIERLTDGDREVFQFTRAKGAFALAISDPLTIADVWRLDGGEMKRLTTLNPLSDLTTPEPFDKGWLLKPPDFDPAKKYPLILQVHGGPRAQCGHAFFHEFLLLAAQGYVVLYTNPRGSQGFGEAFAGAIRDDWGNLDTKDLMESVDRAVKLPFVDASRLGVCGGSYGGYMTNWIIGHTDRFKAAITMRCVSNLASFNGTSDIGFDDFREFGAHSFDDPERYVRMSPITYVKNIKTPLLITHGEADLRCPMEQAEQMFTLLKILNRDVEMVRFPEESHDLSRSGRPDRRVERLRHILRWWREKL